jgi:uncharacterized membrane protein
MQPVIVWAEGKRGPVLRALRAGLLLAVALGVWLFLTPPGLLGKADAIGYSVCHRIDLRSFHLGERALPLCARCTGTYLGIAVTLLLFLLTRPKAAGYPPNPFLYLLGLCVLGYVVDGANSYLGFFEGAPQLYQPSNTLRLVTGTYFGVALATLLYPGFHQSVWRNPNPASVLSTPREAALLLGLGALTIVTVLSGNPMLLYPLALASSATVLVVFGLVYTMVLLMLSGRENQARSWTDVLAPLAWGLLLALAQVALIDLGRYWLTQTWSGFPL